MPTTNVIELRICGWCSRLCVGHDEHGDPACPSCVSDEAAEIAGEEKRGARERRDHGRPSPLPDYAREVRAFVLSEFRAVGALL